MATSFTFGSFGDILALTNLTITCVRSLNDSVGSASDFQDFIDELESLKDDLDTIAAHSDAAMIKEGRSTPTSASTYSSRAIEQCHMAIKVFHDNVKKYETKLNAKGPKSWYYKMFWAIWKKDQITDFRLKLARHRHAITMLQFALQREQVSRISAAVDLPPSVKYTIANSIKFVDAVGSSVLFPIDWCSSWKKLDAMLKAQFSDAPFGQFVREGEYTISSQCGKVIIHPQAWCRKVRPGMEVVMSIILRKIEEIDSSKICPICRYRNSDTSPQSEGWIYCLGTDCNARFQMSRDQQCHSDLQAIF
ncbi:hypothetical protein BD410DRAFT_794390 [Rickenella mellea]|uniref:Ubiquitin-like domain-containing protein n=1 Tax=Rickenella mellea TaxID=50990 RepID=A0A4Y7PPR4_9AGAM|nr:hypothetical protein BD410DRAFT_794390 [Rickenella mellea]